MLTATSILSKLVLYITYYKVYAFSMLASAI